MEETVNLKEIMQGLKKRLGFIVAITLLSAFSSGMVSYYLMTPMYQASTQILVNQEKTEQQLYNSSELEANIQLINTYNVIMRSPAILEKVSETIAIGLTAEELAEKIMISSEQDSQVMNVSVQDTNQERAANIANEIALVFQREIFTIMNIRNVSILSPAKVEENPVPVQPQPFFNIILAAFIGLLVSIGLSVVLDYLDNTIKNEQDVEKLLDLAVLGTVATIETRKLKNNKTNTLKPKEAGGEGIGF